jgi:hypothetical protein
MNYLKVQLAKFIKMVYDNVELEIQAYGVQQQSGCINKGITRQSSKICRLFHHLPYET